MKGYKLPPKNTKRPNKPTPAPPQKRITINILINPNIAEELRKIIIEDCMNHPRIMPDAID